MNDNLKDHKNPQDSDSGILYVVGTPIGNLEDITLRALRILKSVDFIAAENTKHSKRLCEHYDIKTKLISYNQHNSKARTPELVKKIKHGLSIALVTNAGTPVLSDPGAGLISEAIENNITVSPVPGPSALIASISVCGLKVDKFLFQGFLSNKSGRRRKELMDMMDEKRALVFYEAPHRIKSMLMDINDIMGDRYVVLLRELTKLYEEIKRGNATTLIQELDRIDIKGEFTVIVAGNEAKKENNLIDDKTIGIIKKLLKEKGMGVKEIATQLSNASDLNYRKIYKEALKIKKDNTN